MRRGERNAWFRISEAAWRIATSQDAAEEYTSKIDLREAWAKLNGIPNVSGIPRSGSRP